MIIKIIKISIYFLYIKFYMWCCLCFINIDNCIMLMSYFCNGFNIINCIEYIRNMCNSNDFCFIINCLFNIFDV